MNPTDAVGFWVQGNYLHRLYIDKNPLLYGVNFKKDNSRIVQALQKKMAKLESAEDRALKKLYLFVTGKSGSPNDGLEILKDVFMGSSGVVNTLNRLVDSAYEENPTLNVASEEGKKIITEVILKYIEKTYKSNNNSDTKLGKIYSDMYDSLVKEINYLPEGKENITNINGFKGLANEKLIHALMNYNIYNALEDNNNTAGIDRAIEKLKDEAYYLSKNIGDRIVNGRRSSVDEVITIPLESGIGKIPIQIKTKPKSTNTTIQFVQGMEIDKLLKQASIDSMSKKAIKTALINQHYWASGFYKRLVRAAAQKQGYDLPGNFNNTHPTAIERLDEESVLDPLKGITKSFASAIMYGVVVGVDKSMNLLFYIVAGTNGYTIIRSSELLRSMFGGNDIKESAMKNLMTSGRMRIKGEPIVDKSVETYFSQNNGDGYRKNAIVRDAYPRSDWYGKTSSTVDSVYQKMAITLSFNYGNIGKEFKEG